jgi:hypothetical protein
VGIESPRTSVPDFHDGLLTGIRVADGRADIYCSTVAGQEYIWQLSGVRGLFASSFREGNIIFEVTLHEGELPVNLVKRAFGSEDAGEPPWVSAELARPKHRQGILIEITSSYGCELVALFEDGFRVEAVTESSRGYSAHS